MAPNLVRLVPNERLKVRSPDFMNQEMTDDLHGDSAWGLNYLEDLNRELKLRGPFKGGRIRNRLKHPKKEKTLADITNGKFVDHPGTVLRKQDRIPKRRKA